MNLKITKSNAIVNSSYRFSLNEMRIVLFGLSQIDTMGDDFPLFHRIHIKELAEFYDIGEKDRGSFYDNIKHALLNKFWTREFSYYDEDLGEVVRRQWLIEVRYGRKDGSLAYHYNPLLKKELQKLVRRFTSYFLTNVSSMKSIYSIRIYEIAIMYLNASGQHKTVFHKEIATLKHNLDIEDKYQEMYNFKARVLERARKEINKLSDITIKYEVIKRGRTPHEIKFIVTRKKGLGIERKQRQRTFEGHATPIPPTPKVPMQALEEGKALVLKAGTGWDLYAIEQEFYEHMRKNGLPNNLHGAFIGFVKKKVLRCP